jgi:hypothetical protein
MEIEIGRCGGCGCLHKENGPAKAEPEPSRNQPTEIDEFENLMPGAGIRSDQLGWEQGQGRCPPQRITTGRGFLCELPHTVWARLDNSSDAATAWLGQEDDEAFANRFGANRLATASGDPENTRGTRARCSPTNARRRASAPVGGLDQSTGNYGSSDIIWK